MASYPSRNASEPPSQAIVWDAILASPSEPWHQNQYVHPRIKATSSGSSVKSGKGSSSSSSSSKPGLGILRLRGQKPKYQITDVKGRLAGRGNATLELKYNVQPWVGPLLWSGGRSVGLWKALTGGLSDVFHFPDLKTKATDTGTAKGGERNRGKPA